MRRQDTALDAMLGADQARRRVALLIGAVLLALMLAVATGAKPAHGLSRYDAGRCAWLAPHLAAAHLPVATFQRIAWHESGCSATGICTVDRDDMTCSRFGVNMRTAAMRRVWRSWCGVTSYTQLRNISVDLRCVRAAYGHMGLRPWR